MSQADELAGLRGFEALLEEERAALAAGPAERIAAIAARKLEAARGLAAARRSHAPGAQHGELAACARRIRALSERNAAFAALKLRQTEALLALLLPGAAAAPLYAADGRVAANLPPRTRARA